MVEKQRITDKITHLLIRDQGQLAKIFGRAQEHYESPHFHGKVFTFDEMIGFYFTQGFNYIQSVGGYNLPSRALKPLRDGQFDPLSKEEEFLLEAFPTDDHYIIGTPGTSQRNLMHEIAHGLFATVPEYKEEVQSVLEKLTELQVRGINAHLETLHGCGYHSSVHEDETHAYILSQPDTISSAPNPDVDTGAFSLFSPVIDYMEVVGMQSEIKDIFGRHYDMATAKLK